MRKTTVLAACGALAVAAACTIEKVGPQRHADHRPAGLSASQANDPSRVDTGGGRLPDLIVDSVTTQNIWLVREEFISDQACSAIEGGVTPGVRRVVRFTVTTPNIGDADVFVGSPLKHADPNGDGDFSDSDGMFEFAACHNHFHFQNYATYKLISATDGKVWKTAKRGFCMLDTDPAPASYGEPPQGPKNYWNCGTKTVDGFQGVSHAWADTYIWQLAGQYFVLDGGDGQPVVPPGKYFIEITVNPAFAPSKKGCAFATDSQGLCHNFAEENYDNNTTRVAISIPSHVGRDGHGPLKGAKDAEVDHKPN